MNILIVGGGFGGVKAALELAKHDYNQITLVSDKPDFQFYPALYSTATGHSKRQSWIPLGTIFAKHKNVNVLIDTAVKLDAGAKIVTGKSGKNYYYDRCILALGSITTYFGIEGLDVYSYGVKSAEEIAQLKHHLFQQMGEQHVVDKHYVIVGGGPTGVELAATLGTYIERLRVHYRLPKQKIRINLVEGSPRLLPRMHEKISAKVRKRLEKIGVHVETGKVVQAATADSLTVSGRPIKSSTVIWTSGVASNPFYKDNADQFELSKNNKVVVDKHLQGAHHVYILGDNAFTPFSGLAQVALHDALYISDYLTRQHEKLRVKKYKAVMPPVVVPVGENWAVFEWKKLRLSGFVASLLRRAADVIGYSDVAPLGLALGIAVEQERLQDEYFAPTPSNVE